MTNSNYFASTINFSYQNFLKICICDQLPKANMLQ